MKSRVVLPLLLALFSAMAAAQILPRNIPVEAKRAQIRHYLETTVTVDGTPVSLSPGGHIRDQNNLIIVPSALPAGGTLGRYLLDANGQAYRIWLLTPEEAAGDDSKSTAP